MWIAVKTYSYKKCFRLNTFSIEKRIQFKNRVCLFRTCNLRWSWNFSFLSFTFLVAISSNGRSSSTTSSQSRRTTQSPGSAWSPNWWKLIRKPVRKKDWSQLNSWSRQKTHVRVLGLKIRNRIPNNYFLCTVNSGQRMDCRQSNEMYLVFLLSLFECCSRLAEHWVERFWLWNFSHTLFRSVFQYEWSLGFMDLKWDNKTLL